MLYVNSSVSYKPVTLFYSENLKQIVIVLEPDWERVLVGPPLSCMYFVWFHLGPVYPGTQLECNL